MFRKCLVLESLQIMHTRSRMLCVHRREFVMEFMLDTKVYGCVNILRFCSFCTQRTGKYGIEFKGCKFKD